MVVFAVTFALPSSSREIEFERVTAANSALNASSLRDFRGSFSHEIGRLATFPVETPPTVSEVGRLS